MSEGEKYIPRDELGDEIIEYARNLQKQHLMRPKLTVIKASDTEYHLCFEHSDRTKKEIFVNASFERVMTDFLRVFSEDMFGMEFEFKE